MAQIGRFIDGPYYGSQDFAEFFTNFLSTGFFNGLDVEATDTMNITVAPGSAFIEGYEYRNTTDLTLTVPTAEPTADRIDRVVVRLDRTPDASEHITAMVRRGGSEPPELIRNESVYEISLAQILVEAGKSFIEQYQITDERGDKDLCGRVDLPSRFTEQIDEIDIRTPDVPAGEYAEGFSRFRLSGESSGESLKLWLDSIGVSPEDYGRELSQLRAYVETTGNRTNTGVQTITIYDWSTVRNYRIYGKFTRASNAGSSGSSWGVWQEEKLLLEKGRVGDSFYEIYADGTARAWGNRRIVASADTEITAGHGWWRTETFSFDPPIGFERVDYVNYSLDSRSTFNAFVTTGSGDALSCRFGTNNERTNADFYLNWEVQGIANV